MDIMAILEKAEDLRNSANYERRGHGLI